MNDEAAFTLSADDALLTSGAARELECTPDNVRYLERTGRLPAVRVNGVRVFRRQDVERLRRERLRTCENPDPVSA